MQMAHASAAGETMPSIMSLSECGVVSFPYAYDDAGAIFFMSDPIISGGMIRFGMHATGISSGSSLVYAVILEPRTLQPLADGQTSVFTINIGGQAGTNTWLSFGFDTLEPQARIVCAYAFMLQMLGDFNQANSGTITLWSEGMGRGF